MNVLIPVRPDDPPFFTFLAPRSQDGIRNGTVANERWQHWSNDWRNSPLEHLWAHLHRTDATSALCRRVVIEAERRTPNALDPMAVTNGMAWDAIDRNHREIIIECVEQRRAEDRSAGRPELVVQFYTGVINNGCPQTTNNCSSNGILDLDNDAAREKFKRAWFPWIECGVLSGLGFDAGMRTGRTDKTIALMRNCAEWIDGWGSFSEAFPWVEHQGGVVTEWASVPDDVELWCLARYMLQRDPDGKADTRQIGGRRLWVASSPHTTNTGQTGALTPDQARDFAARGFGVASAAMGPPYDSVVNLPPAGRDPSIGGVT